MMKTDLYALASLQVSLVGLLLLALMVRVRTAYRRRAGWAEATMTRGEQSMNGLFTAYGIATVVFTLSIDVSSGCLIDGNKSTVVLFDYAVLTYLFFFDSWFRNSIVFKTLNRIRQD